MNHSDTNDLLPEYASGEVSSTERTEIDLHLKACSECRADLERWRSLKSTLFAQPPLTSDTEAFVASVMVRLPKPSLKSRLAAGIWWKIPVFAAIAMAILITGSPSVDANLSTETLLLTHTSNEKLDDLPALVWGEE